MDDFYIGWQDEAPTPYGKSKRLFWIVGLLVAAVSAVLIAKQQGPFSNSVFEYGELSVHTGILQYAPVPSLVVQEGDTEKRILLVGFGKKGALESLRDMEEEQGQALENQQLSLRGTLIYFADKTLLELTEGSESLVAVGPAGNVAARPSQQGKGILLGEILDAKCYFGVMKPGEGKPHKSCAARCLSGGIPAVFKADSSEGTDYYLLLNAGGQPQNDLLLPYAGEAVAVCGTAYQHGDWKLLYLDVQDPIRRLGPPGSPLPPMCTQ